ncbi:hypothetical protein QCA50_011800 [Cerrena zonata]|uniref:PARP-type domain-containing protein n=1 Tax=Cerrena zonata TaxID=2478898 RepID=A0AAW0G1H1_9APHY
MSDSEGGTKERKGGYRLDYATNNRSGCKGPKPCAGTKIVKGELRLAALVDFRGNTSWAYRHWGCVTPKVISNMKEIFDNAADLDGFDELEEADQEKITKAWEDGDDDEEEGGKKKGKKAAAKKEKKEEDDKGNFKVEYASSGRSKCKTCKDQIGKDFFRVGDEVEFRGHKSMAWQHWGCTPADLIAKLKRTYTEAESIPGFDEIKEAEQEKIRNAWEADEIPEDDKGPGEAIDTGKKKAPAPRKAKKAKDSDDGEEERPKKRVRKAKKDEDDDDEEEEKPKAKRAPAKKAEKAAPKKRASKKKAETEEESGEDFR